MYVVGKRLLYFKCTESYRSYRNEKIVLLRSNTIFQLAMLVYTQKQLSYFWLSVFSALDVKHLTSIQRFGKMLIWSFVVMLIIVV